MILKIIGLSLKSISNNKMRSFLTMLGIIIGVMAVVILVSITEGASKGITDSISDMGSNLISVNITDEDASIAVDDLDQLSSYSSIESLSPTISTSYSVKKGSNSGRYSVVGVNEDYFDVVDEDIQRGRILLDSDMEWNTNVCVIGTSVATDLFETWDAVGGTITINNRIYTVVGVLEEQGSSLVGSDDNKILIPYTTASRNLGSKTVSSFYVKASHENMIDMTISNIESYLYQLIRDEEAYEVNNQSEVLSTMDDVTNTMSLLLAGIAAISLVVGGIGIMNIMLVSVSERTREIGVRKAVGAKRKHILLQFLCEACVLSLLGGAIGLLLSVGGIEIYNIYSSSMTAMNWNVGLYAVAFCVVIGVVFGLYPAIKASSLSPIEALRSN